MEHRGEDLGDNMLVRNACTVLLSNSRLGFRPLLKMTIVVLTALLISCGGEGDPESFGAKHENSVLLTIDAKFTAPLKQALEFVDFEDYHFLHLRSGDETVWIMLNPRHTPFYKQAPWNRTFVLTQQQFEEIDKKGTATLTTIQCLASHIGSER